MKLNARDCKVIEVDCGVEREFLRHNHTQGYAKSSVCYGLCHNNELVQLMSFGKPRFNKNYQWEIIRECSKKDTTIRGGTSKLWKHFIKNNKCHSCICYHYPHDTKTLYTSHLIDNCGFKCIKHAKESDKIYFEGIWEGKNKRIDKSILERHGVDRLLHTSQGQDRTNEQILIDLGFEKKTEKGYDPQIDIYYPFGLVYRIDDLTDGSFYIGMSENEEAWNNGYMGSGERWLNHVNKHKDHDYKRTIISYCENPKDTRNLELREIKKSFSFENGTWIKTNDKCMNTQVRTQTTRYVESIECPECGAKHGKHKSGCSHIYKCSECGSPTMHKKTCSKYKERKRCPECGGTNTHFKTCSKYIKKIVCEECGGLEGKHKKGCSKRLEASVCNECGGLNNNHKKTCSKYNKVTKICSECGGLDGKHKKECSLYKQPTPCEECGGIRSHKPTCSKYKKQTPCPECGVVGGHKKSCSRVKRCPECGGYPGHHKKSCSKYKDEGVCPECGYKLRSRIHAKSCSKYRPPKSCPECGKTYGHHDKTCSKYKERYGEKD